MERTDEHYRSIAKSMLRRIEKERKERKEGKKP